eukprot:GHVT01060684.1.p1 GENE.GHVT01060684.1~~GHVT01060684.1.p1  ORF type:complete len:140 (-),score=12.14 GHVT01060684.1:13-432(-)
MQRQMRQRAEDDRPLPLRAPADQAHHTVSVRLQQQNGSQHNGQEQESSVGPRPHQALELELPPQLVLYEYYGWATFNVRQIIVPAVVRDGLRLMMRLLNAFGQGDVELDDLVDAALAHQRPPLLTYVTVRARPAGGNRQ